MGAADLPRLETELNVLRRARAEIDLKISELERTIGALKASPVEDTPETGQMIGSAPSIETQLGDPDTGQVSLSLASRIAPCKLVITSTTINDSSSLRRSTGCSYPSSLDVRTSTRKAI